jgi:WD40 repeat protein/energy-coupling factor transporter ATP-binding protein EcfA2
VIGSGTIARSDTPPFPGLRSFRPAEAHLFFGRDGQSNEIIRQCVRSQFVAVVGTSGCGKSSLVRAGLLPSLYAGYFAAAGSKWTVADIYPRSDPIGNLSRALLNLGLHDDASSLNDSSSAVADLVRSARDRGQVAPDENFLILVDQFEELFRYVARAESPTADRDEKTHFVRLLLGASRESEQRIYVIITMRADFLGDCAQFRDLPEAINRGQYLVPRMTRQQRRAAIEGPIRVAGGAIAPRLTQRMLNELGEDPDQLPVLQHALLRTWDAWAQEREFDQPIDFDDYESIGGFELALSRHADAILAEVAKQVPGGETAVKLIFQRLRDRDANGRETRRPTSVKELQEVAGLSFEQIRLVLESFRDDTCGSTFLTPLKTDVPEIGEQTEIDVTHESLLRRWRRLANEWVREEEESRRAYTRLATRAEEEGPATQNFLKGPLLERTLEWWEERNPNTAWAKRYHPGFEQAKKFLFDSRAERDRLLKKEEDARKEEEDRRIAKARTRSAYWLAGVSLVGLVIAAIFGVIAWMAHKSSASNLLASKAALAANDNDASLPVSMLLAADSLERQFSIDAQVLVSQALALIPSPGGSLTSSAIRQVAFGPDGHTLATLSRDGSLQLWNVDDKSVRTTINHSGKILSFALSGSSPIVVAGQDDGHIRLWDADKNEERAALTCDGPISSVAVSGDGLTVAALCSEKLSLWRFKPNWVKPKLVSSWAQSMVKGQKEPSWQFVALEEDGRRVAVAHHRSRGLLDEDFESGDQISVRDVQTGVVLARGSFADRVNGLAFTATDFDSSQLATADAAGNVKFWPLPGFDAKIRSAAFGPAKIGGSEPPQSSLKNSDAITSLQATDDNLIVGCRNGVTRLWSRGNEVARIVEDRPVVSVAFSEATGTIVTVRESGELRLWNAARDRVHLGRILNARFSDHGQILIYRSGFVKVLNLQDWSTTTFSARQPFPVAIVQGDKQVIVRDSRTLSFTIRSFANGTLGTDIWPQAVKYQGVLSPPVLSPDGKHLAAFMRRMPTGPETRLGLYVWDSKTGTEERYQPVDPSMISQVPRFAFTPDSQRLLIASRDRGLHESAIASTEVRVLSIERDQNVSALAFSPDGSLLATGARKTRSATEIEADEGVPTQEQARVNLWRYTPGAGKLIRSFDSALTRDLLFSADSRLLLSSDSNKSVRLWDVATGQLLAQTSVLDPILAIAFTSYGRIAIVDRTQLTLYWWRPEDLIREACGRVSRNLSPQQWARLVPGERYHKTCKDLP